ncbi:MAG: serine/threonine protein phosphatase, partial [Proteobacteria bacterium]|nr:serine/threonine protein phosphatase [Pseudomonadota bacterium]
QNLIDAVGSKRLAWLRDLPLYHQTPDYLFVHAGILPGKRIEKQKERDLLWIRERFLNSDKDHGRMVIHGHTPMRNPDVRSNRIGIDTGAFRSGCLTCLVLEGASRRFLST